MAHIRETLAEHHARVAQIIIALHPSPSVALIDAALHHDAGEPAVGDNPWPAKRDNPELRVLLDAAEAKERRRIGVPEPQNDDDAAWLRMADRLSAYMHVRHVAPHQLIRKDWRSDRLEIEKMAMKLGCWVQVSEVMGVSFWRAIVVRLRAA
jgi:5'-deoxynucleotidase